MATPIKLSLTNFLDFVSTPGAGRVGRVRRLQQQYGQKYHPVTDYWRDMRNAIVEYHEHGLEPASIMKAANSAIRERNNFRAAALGYKKFLGRKDIEWFAPKRATWKAGDIAISVNPELGLAFKGDRHLVKLYFRKDPLPKRRADAALFLMFSSLGCARNDTVASIIDVQRGSILTASKMSSDQAIYLKGEALALSGIWNALDDD